MAERTAPGVGQRAPSGRSGGAAPPGVAQHLGRIALLALVAFIIHLLFPSAPVPDVPVPEVGTVAEDDIIARVGFPVYKSAEALARERDEAAAAVAPILAFDATALDSMQSRIGVLLARIERAAAQPDAARDRALQDVLRQAGLVVGPEIWGVLRDSAPRAELSRELYGAVRAGLPRGVASGGDLQGSAAQIQIRAGGADRIIPRDSVATASTLFASRTPPEDPRLAELERLILTRLFVPSLVLDQEATRAARERARQAVAAVKADVLPGEKIVGANERIGEGEQERLRAYREHLARIGALGAGWDAVRSLGAWLFNFLILLIFGLVTYLYRRPVYESLRHVTLLLGLTVALFVGAAVVAHTRAPVELVPIAFPIIVVAALWDARMALTFSLVLAVLLAGQTAFAGIASLFTFSLAGAGAAFSVRAVRRRAETWTFITVIALAYAAAAVTLGLLRAYGVEEVLRSTAWGTANAIASALLAMGFLPLFESFARITTHQTLLELADLNRPLLQRLSREAPGTFAHSINVANLAEAAARAIDANALLARVGLYYHDIGKIGKPQYFIENQPQGRNPHDKLKPGTSASIVRHHVLDGLRLADEYRLPPPIRAFIAEHHGTQSIGFFLDRARESDPAAELDAREFAYPGPKPRSRETAIAMLADSVESAARVLTDPTPERIAGLVDRIVDGKVALGQLDDAPMTLRDLRLCKEAFAGVLTGMYHQRIDYPATREPAATAGG